MAGAALRWQATSGCGGWTSSANASYICRTTDAMLDAASGLSRGSALRCELASSSRVSLRSVTGEKKRLGGTPIHAQIAVKEARSG